MILSQYLLQQNEKKEQNIAKEYELIFIDQHTLKPVEFKNSDIRVKIMVESPALILPITLSSVKFTSTKVVSGEPIFLQFENAPDYSLLDRKQPLHEGKNEIFVISNKKDPIEHQSKINTILPLKTNTVLPPKENTISGYVIDEEGKPLSNAQVIVVTTQQKIFTDAEGGFKINILAINERIRIKAVKDGYTSWEDYVLSDKLGIKITLHPIK